jgi:hypothetical protein
MDDLTTSAAPLLDQQTNADLIGRLLDIRTEVKELEEQKKALGKEADVIERQLLDRLTEQGATKLSSNRGTAIVTETVHPNVADWDAVYEYIRENDAFHLMQRRLSAPAYRELLDNNVNIPGTSPFTKRELSLRTS